MAAKASLPRTGPPPTGLARRGSVRDNGARRRSRSPAFEGDTVAESYNGYCVKCKEKRDFEGEVKVSESGRRMAQGTCPVCGTKMNRILGKA